MCSRYLTVYYTLRFSQSPEEEFQCAGAAHPVERDVIMCGQELLLLRTNVCHLQSVFFNPNLVVGVCKQHTRSFVFYYSSMPPVNSCAGF